MQVRDRALAYHAESTMRSVASIAHARICTHTQNKLNPFAIYCDSELVFIACLPFH